MQQEQKVQVFNFRSFALGLERSRQADYKATRERIRRTPGSELLEGTGESVDLHDLDDEGRFRRQPTGWLPG